MMLTTLADDLRRWGCTVTEHDNWQTATRPGTFRPAGVVIHHTAGPSGRDAPSLGICINGRPDLPGPLCNILIARSGTCHVIAAGITNHAGAGAWRGLRGNATVVGIELENTGVGEPWPAAQLDAAHRATAAVADRINCGSSMVCGHKEWTTRKIDPAGIDMDDFRAAVARLLINGPGDDTMPTTQPDEMVRQWQQMLLANGAQLGPAAADGLFGRLTLGASQTILDDRNRLLAEVGALAAQVDTLNASIRARANDLAAATAEVLTLREQLVAAGTAPARLAALLAAVEAAVVEARA